MISYPLSDLIKEEFEKNGINQSDISYMDVEFKTDEFTFTPIMIIDIKQNNVDKKFSLRLSREYIEDIKLHGIDIVDDLEDYIKLINRSGSIDEIEK